MQKNEKHVLLLGTNQYNITQYDILRYCNIMKIIFFYNDTCISYLQYISYMLHMVYYIVLYYTILQYILYYTIMYHTILYYNVILPDDIVLYITYC